MIFWSVYPSSVPDINFQAKFQRGVLKGQLMSLPYITCVLKFIIYFISLSGQVANFLGFMTWHETPLLSGITGIHLKVGIRPWQINYNLFCTINFQGCQVRVLQIFYYKFYFSLTQARFVVEYCKFLFF